MNDLDELMGRDPLELSSQDIDRIIAYHRNARVRKAEGKKPEKSASATIDLSKIKTKLAPKTTQTFRRI